MDSYETDFFSWSQNQAHLLRDRAAGTLANDPALDWANIAEEIESVGRSERASLAGHIGAVIEHLLKLQASPATAPRLGWTETILRTRAAIEDISDDSPSLRQAVEPLVVRAAAQKLRLISDVLDLYGEKPTTPLDQLSYTPEQVLGAWLPDDPA